MELRSLFSPPPYPPSAKQEVEKMISELMMIAREDDFLSEHPGGVFNVQCKHVRARNIGKRLGELGGLVLMEWVFNKVKRKLGKHDKRTAEHLGYCWNDLNEWKY